jgi:predicted dehydrogenase
VTTDHVHSSWTASPAAYVAEIVDFVAAIARGTPASVTGADGRAALALAYAAEASVRERCPVAVSRFARGGTG